jgi:NodT family efflux transporter outer membrane factor (OMF) lipoprotein
MKALVAIGTFTAVGLAGCVFPQREEPATAPIKVESLGLAGQAYRGVEAGWWKAFGDPQLDSLMDEALRANPTLAQAMARVRSAEAQAYVAGTDYSPRFSADVDDTWQRFSESYYVPPPYGGTRNAVGQATAGLSWGLDFWGRQGALIQAARSQVVANKLDATAAKLALSGAIAATYVDLNRSWELIDIANRTQEQRQHLLELTEQRVSAGIDTQVELKTAQAALPKAHASLLQAMSARDIAVHRLAALTGNGAKRYDQIARPQLQADATLALPDELPLDLLAHRPDVLAARARVNAATAGRAAARADFYPDVDLKAFVGVQAIGINRLLESGSLVYGVGPAIHMPLFESARLRAAYHGAAADLDAAVASYNGTVLEAVRETADQMSLSQSLQQQIDALAQSSELASSAYELAQKRYGAGLSNQLVVLQTESRVLEARRDLAMASSDWVVARVRLLLLLGGSFEPENAVLSGTSP